MAYREAALMSRFHHPNIIDLHECFITDRVLCIVMEYATGGTLETFLQKRVGKLLTQDVSIAVVRTSRVLRGNFGRTTRRYLVY